MLDAQEYKRRQSEAYEMFMKAGIFVTPDESARIEIADFGISAYEHTGLAVLVYVNTDRCCAKELAMLPRQACPEHLHPPVGSDPGKEETFRCRWGKVYLYVPGKSTTMPNAKQPPGHNDAYTVFNEVALGPGDQYTIAPNTLHWFQAGDEGAVVSEFSTRSTDENDIFTDPEIHRVTRIKQ